MQTGFHKILLFILDLNSFNTHTIKRNIYIYLLFNSKEKYSHFYKLDFIDSLITKTLMRVLEFQFF